jgi:hypothetical protein
MYGNHFVIYGNDKLISQKHGLISQNGGLNFKSGNCGQKHGFGTLANALNSDAHIFENNVDMNLEFLLSTVVINLSDCIENRKYLTKPE